jgi:hypothetical protein
MIKTIRKWHLSHSIIPKKRKVGERSPTKGPCIHSALLTAFPRRGEREKSNSPTQAGGEKKAEVPETRNENESDFFSRISPISIYQTNMSAPPTQPTLLSKYSRQATLDDHPGRLTAEAMKGGKPRRVPNIFSLPTSTLSFKSFTST